MSRKSFASKATRVLFNAAKAFFSLAGKAFVAVGKIILKIFSLLFSLLKKGASGAAAGLAKKAAMATSSKPTFAGLGEVRVFEGSAAEFEEWLYASKSTVGIILGARGSGKSGLGLRLLENWAARGRSVFAMGFGESSLPPWIHSVDAVEKAANGSALLVDEGGILFSARESMSTANKLLSQLLFVARHKDLSLLFISQNSSSLEINTVRQADYLLLKRPSLLQQDFERSRIKDIYSAAAGDFRELAPANAGLVYVYSDKFRGFASNPLPSFWSERTGKAFGRAKLGK